MDAAFQYVSSLLQTAKKRPHKFLTHSKSEPGKWRSLQQKLVDVYLEECAKQTKPKELFTGSHLLEKLVAREKFNCLVVNLFPGVDGYSLCIKTKTGVTSETIKLPYEEEEILQYIDNEELPPLLVDLLERSQIGAFYGGCVIAEVRDYRRSTNPSSYICYHVLLKPTMQTLICDVNMLTNDGQKWSTEDKHALESSLLLATSEPLCLDPSPAVAIISNHLQYKKRFLATVPLKKIVGKNSQIAINRKRRFEHGAAPAGLKLFDFLKKNKVQHQPVMNIKFGKQIVDRWKQPEPNLAAPISLDVDKFAVSVDRPSTVTTDNTPITVEEYIMETDRNAGKVHFTHVTICQRPTDEQYFGKLYVDREGQHSGSTCTFPLGNKLAVEKYISQFSEIFTEEGRKSVKITHKVPGFPPTVRYTPGAKESNFESSSNQATNSSNAESSDFHPPPAKKIALSRQAQNTPTTSTSVTSSTNKASSAAPLLTTTGHHTTTVSHGPVTTTTPSAAFHTQASSHEAAPVAQNILTVNTSDQFYVSGLAHGAGTITDASNDSAPSVTTANLTNVNLASLGLAPNINLHNLVSLAGVPISLTMMSSSPMTSPAGMIMTTVPSLVPASVTSTASQSSIAVRDSGSSEDQQTLLVNAANAAGQGSSATLLVSSGAGNSSVLASPTGMLSLPLGTLNAHLMSQGLRNVPEGLKTTPMSLLQVSGNQQSLPLINSLQCSLEQVARGNAQQRISVTTAVSNPVANLSNAASGLSVSQPLVTLTSQQQQQFQLALSKQLGLQQIQKQPAVAKSQSKPKNKRKSTAK